MKLRKILTMALCGAVLMTTMASCGKDSGKSEEDIMTVYSLNNDNTKLVGRTWNAEDNTLWLALSGSGCEFTYTGKKLVIDVVGDDAAATPVCL